MSGWVRFENTMPEHLKVAPLSDRAYRLWTHAICYCSRAQTDGLVPAPLAPSLSLSATRKTVEELVRAGLFEPVPEGYRVHGYLDYNPSKNRISEMRESNRERVRNWRDTHPEQKSNGVTDANVTALPNEYSRARDRSVVVTSEERELFEYWTKECDKPRAKFTVERQAKVRARIKEGYSFDDLRRGVDGAAANPPRDRDTGVVHDDLVSVCRNGAQLERYMERAEARPEAPVGRAPALQRMDRWNSYGDAS